MSGYEPRSENRWTVLVIDDDPGTARLITDWFQGKPYEILQAPNGPRGLEIAATMRPDVILLDLVMPGEDGLSVAHKLKDSTTTRAIPIILLTACRDVNHKVEAFAAGADDYVTKPFEFEEIDARIQAMLRRSDFLTGLESTIRDLQMANSELERLLTLDEKTGLHNFREFRRKLREEWLRAERYDTPLSLVLLDIDNFKKFNDTYGHPAADRALTELAMLVAGGARVTDMAARYGGEEFAVILPHTEADMAFRVAERTRAAIEDFTFLADESPTRITVSIGIATYPSPADVENADELLRLADRALYEAKRLGKNRVVAARPATAASARAGVVGSDRSGGRTHRDVDSPSAG